MKIIIKNSSNCPISSYELDTKHRSISEAIAEILNELDWPLEAGDKIEIVAETENEGE